MRKSVTILLTLLLSVMVLGLAVAVPHGSLQADTVEHLKNVYQPAEFDFLNGIGGDGSGAADEDTGVDFGEDEDEGIDFGDEE